MAEAPLQVTVTPARRETPEISVLVPICNVERYLEECLDSLLAQSFSDFEVLMVNDGSTDGSRAIMQRYLDRDDRFRAIDKPNSGYGASMNLGLDNAVGTFIAILESDDFYEPDALYKMHQAAIENRSDVVKADFWLYWSKPEPRQELFRIVDDQEAGHTLRPLDDFAIFFRKPSIWSALYRRDFLESHGIRFLETPGASYQDAGFNFKVWVSTQRATFLSDPVLFYRQDNEKSSVNSPSKVYCVCDEYAAMQEFIEGVGGDRQRLRAILERMKFDSYMWNYDRLSKDLRLEFIVRASHEFTADQAAGAIDFTLFEPWAEADLRALIEDPQGFDAYRTKFTAPGKFNSLKHYLRLGGVPLVAKALAFKAFKTSSRRINAQGGAA